MSNRRTIAGVPALKQLVGEELGVSDWREITQPQVDAFAELTDDHQWIHVDPARAAGTAFGGTIVHGFLTLSLAPSFMAELFTVTHVSHGLNYGLDRVRFPAPLPVGSRLRMRATLTAADDLPDGGLQTTTTFTFEREGGDKPVCVAESLGRYYP
ncbi:MAG: MaoC family dehydratase [Patulibacter sp.]|nr:MaoC family dehydratase [Patulibacter sp.]